MLCCQRRRFIRSRLDTARGSRCATSEVAKRKPIEERIADFKAEFESGKKYPASEFFKWHHILTGSCEFGRREFCRQHNIDLENGQYTVEEFIEITKNAYGGEVIKKLK